jgi:hypothetical protein
MVAEVAEMIYPRMKTDHNKQITRLFCSQKSGIETLIVTRYVVCA